MLRFGFKACGSVGSADFPRCPSTCMQRLLKAKLAAVRKKHAWSHTTWTLLWTTALAGAGVVPVPAEGVKLGSLPPCHSSTVTKKPLPGFLQPVYF